jgi:hypothetical protein
MILAPWYGAYEAYTGIYTETSFGYVILDNGIFEGEQLPISKLLKIRQDTHADVMVLPDVHGDAGETLKRSVDACRKIFDDPFSHGFSVMFVPQGVPARDWFVCLDIFLSYWTEEPRPVELVLGLAEACPHQVSAGMQSQLYPRIKVLPALLEYDYPVHLLGMPSVENFVRYELEYVNGVASVDTSIAYTLGMFGLPLRVDSPKMQIFPISQWNTLPTDSQLMLIELNRNILDRWAATGRTNE